MIFVIFFTSFFILLLLTFFCSFFSCFFFCSFFFALLFFFGGFFFCPPLLCLSFFFFFSTPSSAWFLAALSFFRKVISVLRFTGSLFLQSFKTFSSSCCLQTNVHSSQSLHNFTGTATTAEIGNTTTSTPYFHGKWGQQVINII